MKPFKLGLLLLLPGAGFAQDWETVSGIFADRCVLCHSGEYAPLGLELDSYAGVMAGSENGPVLAASADASPLFHRINGLVEPRMPMDGPPFLSEAQIAQIAAWIDLGATGPASDEATDQPAPADPRDDGQILYGEVARIFGQSCVRCHSGNGILDAPPEGLRLDTYEAILAGGDRIALIPGNPQASEIIRRIEGLSDPRMPFDGPPWLSDDDALLMRDWIAGGALSDEATPAPLPAGGRVRLRGVMTGVQQIDGVDFIITAETRIDDRPLLGQRAEVRAIVGADGSLIAQRLRDR